MRRPKLRAWGAVAISAALVMGACASGGDEASKEKESGTEQGTVIEAGWVNGTDLEPTTGATLNVALASRPTGLDPTSATHGVGTAGPVFTALYDSLLRYDPETDEITGQLAEGITHNDDFTKWTLTLRPDVRFTDGTPLNSQAVVYSIERMRKARNAAAGYPAYFSSIETPDDRTVVLNLAQPLNNVDELFTVELGFVVSPTAAEAAGAGFATNPVGAGPFKLERFDPSAELVLVKNPDYALGDVRADRVRMTWMPDPNTSIDLVSTGQSDIVFLGNSPMSVARAIEEGLPTYTTLVGGAGYAINNAPGRDFRGDDPRVRRAISLAVDPEVLNERGSDGNGVAGRFLLPPSSRNHVDTPFSVGGVDEARRLVEEVKAETGWDGSFTITTEASRHDEALAAQAQLNAVGFKVDVERLADFSQMIERTFTNRDFDLSTWVMVVYDTAVYQTLSRSLLSNSPSNYLSFANPEVDRLLGELRAAPDGDAFRGVLDRLAAEYQDDVPFFFVGTSPYTFVTTDRVGGIEPTSFGVFLWSDVFKA